MGPTRSAFLSSFFALVGLHGLHVTAGLLWLGTMMAQVFVKGFRSNILRRLICFNLFWHAPRHHLGRNIHPRVSDRRRPMSDINNHLNKEDVGPGFMDAGGHGARAGVQTYLTGLVLAALLTASSFYTVYTDLLWPPAIPSALVALAVAQIGVHLVFFLHITTAPDNTNNVLALAFGVLDRGAHHRRLGVDHGSYEPKHDADASADGDATVIVRRRGCALLRISQLPTSKP